ncbi:MAG: hypothetical protein H6698_02355 [Myxococcales bacterium]|nr:hypothetical protein [Myxococcales bacterium]MCB9533154.1 hypothetical protein [Myxococcales bacterium]
MKKSCSLGLLAVSLLACGGEEGTPTTQAAPVDLNGDGATDEVATVCPDASFPIFADNDNDGFGAGTALEACRTYSGWARTGDDCDDANASVGRAARWFADADDDGLGDPDDSVEACDAPAGYVANADDPDPACAGGVVDACGVCAGPGPGTWFADVDRDGTGDDRITVTACVAPAGFVASGGDPEPDCATNDTDSCGVCAGADRDKDCAGVCFGASVVDACGVCGGPGPRTTWLDTDGDGLGDDATELTTCETRAGEVTAGGDPEPDCATNDTDECGVCGGPGAQTFYPDADGDGRGVEAGATVACLAPAGTALVAGDPEPACPTDDTDECGVCGGPGLYLFYADGDGDGFGDPGAVAAACDPPLGYVANADDPEPGCNTNDEDVCGVCAGAGPSYWYADVDGDGVGDGRARVQACEQPPGFSDLLGDPEPDCATDDTDECGVCAGRNRSRDCAGICFGEAAFDSCGTCSGGTTGVAADDSCASCVATGIAERIIEWNAVPPFSGGAGGPFTFQLILFENGEFRFQYHDLGVGSGTATVGYQTAGGARALELAFDSTFAEEHPFVHFRALSDGGVAVEYAGDYPWISIASVGDRHALADDGSVTIPIGFPFTFWGTTYESLTISSNGIVTFSGALPPYQNAHLPAATLGALIAPLWDDLNPASGGAIYSHLRSGTCEIDCNGLAGGVAAVDECGVCAGGNTGLVANADQDCAGVCFGTAAPDACGVCAGGTTGVEPSDPALCPHGPDLVVDEAYLRSNVTLEYLDVPEGSCLINEGCVRGAGNRRIVRFGTRIGNLGDEDLTLGSPPSAAISSGPWHWDDCHGHHHYEAYARYDLYDVAGDTSLEIGAKSGFCVMDLGVYDTSITSACHGYNCSNQGITAGCQDTYSAGLQCQWVDVTGLPDGDYDLTVTTNPYGELEELDYDNNAASMRIRIAGDAVSVVD